MASLVTLASFGKSLVFGSVGKYSIGSIEVEFKDKSKRLDNPISNVVYQVFNHVFPCITLQYSYQLMRGMSDCIAYKLSSTTFGKLKFTFYNSGISESKIYEAKNLNFGLYKKVYSISNLLFCVGILVTSNAVASTITKPVALVIGASAVFETANHMKDIGLYVFNSNQLKLPEFGWKENSFRVAVYALSLFAASKLI